MTAAAYSEKRERCIQENRRCYSKSNEVSQNWGERRGKHVGLGIVSSTQGLWQSASDLLGLYK